MVVDDEELYIVIDIHIPKNAVETYIPPTKHIYYEKDPYSLSLVPYFIFVD